MQLERKVIKANTLKFYIDGQWVDPAEPRMLEVINPATEQGVATISLGSAADVDKAVTAARKAFVDYSQTSREQRIGFLEKICAVYKRRWNDIASCISNEMGAPVGLASGPQTASGYGILKSTLNILRA